MFAIIKSSLNDDRSFAEMEVFAGTNDEPKMSASDKELYEHLSEINGNKIP